MLTVRELTPTDLDLVDRHLPLNRLDQYTDARDRSLTIDELKSAALSVVR